MLDTTTPLTRTIADTAGRAAALPAVAYFRLCDPQLTFGQLLSSQRAPVRPTDRSRRESHARTLSDLEQTIGLPQDRDKQAATLLLYQLVRDYFSRAQIGATLFSLDLVEHWRRTGDLVRLAHLDARSIGSIAAAHALKQGWIVSDGVGPTGGGERSNSCVRRRYRVIRTSQIDGGSTS